MRQLQRYLACCFLGVGSLLVFPASVAAAGPELKAHAWLLMNPDTGQILASRNETLPLAPLSFTKLMTAYLTFAAVHQGQLRTFQSVTVSTQAGTASGPRMFLETGQTIMVHQLLPGLVVASGNDAAIALAEAIAGSEPAFVQNMNSTARKMGLNQTHFENATGLEHPGQRTTARDLAVLATRLIQDFPEEYTLYQQRETSFPTSVRNTNRLLWLDGHVDGLLATRSNAAGFGIMASAKRNDMRLLAVVAGAPDDGERVAGALNLLNYGFQQFDGVRLYTPGQTLGSIPVRNGRGSSVRLGFPAGLVIAVPRGTSPAQIVGQLHLPDAATAPIEKGASLGTLALSVPGQQQVLTPLHAMTKIEKHTAGLSWLTALQSWWHALGNESINPAPLNQLPLDQ